MRATFKFLLKILISFIMLFILYVIWTLAWSTLHDFQPKEKLAIDIIQNSKIDKIKKDTLSIISWNIGFAGIGENSYMFYDLGKFFLSGNYEVIPAEEKVKSSIQGIQQFVSENQADFYVFQEVDIHSKRSYFIDEYQQISKARSDFSSSIAINYDVGRVPIPILEPWNASGKVLGGLASFSRYKIQESLRLQLPGNYNWPKRIFHLDRCLSKHKIATHYDKDLILINLHNSAYDENGFIKNQQLKYLKNVVLEEYHKGNYVIVGGDWNQSPPGLQIEKVYEGTNIKGQEYVEPSDNFMPESWTWSFDNTKTTSRKANYPYKRGESPEKLIDFYLLSPNIKALHIETLKTNFKYSDHEPIKLNFILKN